jgi:hypothetical protein
MHQFFSDDLSYFFDLVVTMRTMHYHYSDASVVNSSELMIIGLCPPAQNEGIGLNIVVVALFITHCDVTVGLQPLKFGVGLNTVTCCVYTSFPQ